MKVAIAILSGFLLHDVAVYCWHRWVSHAGVLSWIGRDMFRRRHFHHHFVTYPPARLRSMFYAESCDVTFGILEILLLLAAISLVVTGVVPAAVMLFAAGGTVVHGWIAIRIHALCHLPDRASTRQRHWSRALEWWVLKPLRRFHDGHHTRLGNFGLLFPMLDVIARSHISDVNSPQTLPSELFPGFRIDRSSSCGEPLM